MEIVQKLLLYIKKYPKDFAVLAALGFFAILSFVLWLKLNGQSVTLPILEKYVKVVPEGTPATVTKTELNKYSRIVGKYKYRCKSDIKNHGGVCEISLIPTDNGLQWKLEGERLWEQMKDASGKIISETRLDIPYHWSTTWGDYISDQKIAYRYKITKKETHLEGYAEGIVRDNNNVSGNYWQLPPNEPLFGSFEFRRQIDNGDVNWE